MPRAVPNGCIPAVGTWESSSCHRAVTTMVFPAPGTLAGDAELLPTGIGQSRGAGNAPGTAPEGAPPARLGLEPRSPLLRSPRAETLPKRRRNTAGGGGLGSSSPPSARWAGGISRRPPSERGPRRGAGSPGTPAVAGARAGVPCRPVRAHSLGQAELPCGQVALHRVPAASRRLPRAGLAVGRDAAPHAVLAEPLLLPGAAIALPRQPRGGRCRQLGP